MKAVVAGWIRCSTRGVELIENRILNCLPSRDTEQDWLAVHAAGSGLVSTPQALPQAVDLREQWWDVGDQGATGSCVGWATADTLLRWHYVKSGMLDESSRPSVRFHWMAAKETDNFTVRPTTFIEEDGTSLKSALDVARKFGSVREETLPFLSGALYHGDSAGFYSMAAKLRISAYFNLGRNLDGWRRWLAGQGPVLARLDVDATWDQATTTNGVLNRYQADTARGGHAVALVGYNESHFIVRNSWGTQWGDAGYAYATPEYASAAFTEVYGIAL